MSISVRVPQKQTLGQKLGSRWFIHKALQEALGNEWRKRERDKGGVLIKVHPQTGYVDELDFWGLSEILGRIHLRIVHWTSGKLGYLCTHFHFLLVEECFCGC